MIKNQDPKNPLGMKLHGPCMSFLVRLLKMLGKLPCPSNNRNHFYTKYQKFKRDALIWKKEFFGDLNRKIEEVSYKLEHKHTKIWKKNTQNQNINN